MSEKSKQQVKRITTTRDYENGELVSEFQEIEYVTDEPEQLELELDSEEDNGPLKKDYGKYYGDYYRYMWPYYHYWNNPPNAPGYIYTTTWNPKGK